jgi:hypothetical protein
MSSAIIKWEFEDYALTNELEIAPTQEIIALA